MIHALLPHLHDTELWASYLPRIPNKLYLPTALGAALAAFSIWGLQTGANAWAVAGLGLGGLIILPAILAGLFVLWRWNYRSGVRRQMLDSIPWRGDEKVLDVGCGSGLMLNGAAMRLKSGKAIGIDIWAAHGGGGNLDLLWKSARAEGVADRIEFKEADARKMPFEDGAFDVVFCSGALHHISRSFADHEQVMREMVRVLKPGGRIVLWDIKHMIDASASRLGPAGVKCDLKPADPFLGLDMSLLFGQKTV